MAKCIYCNCDADLSESDIFPSALTNATLVNTNVCRIEHNNKFSDAFESKVINDLAFVSNSLDIKSKHSKNYTPYQVTLDIDGDNYNKKITSDNKLFSSTGTIKSTDGTRLLGGYDVVEDIARKRGKGEVSIVDLNKIEVGVSFKFSMGIFISPEMHRMISKIAYEWYCFRNNINHVNDSFKEIIKFITTGEGENIVTVVKHSDPYTVINQFSGHGSHVLYSYADESCNTLFIYVSLFGIALYKVRLCSYEDSKQWVNNCLFEELTIDGEKNTVMYPSLADLIQTNKNKFTPIRMNDLNIMIPKNMTDMSLARENSAILIIIKSIESDGLPEEDIVEIVLSNINRIMGTSILHKRAIKRFVKDLYKDFSEPVTLNPNGTNKKNMFFLFVLFLIGKKNVDIVNESDIMKMVTSELEVNPSNEYNLSDDASIAIKNKIFSSENYNEVIKCGAEIVDKW